MFPAGFEPAIPARERPQTHALDQATIRIGEPVNVTKCEYDHRRRRKSDVHKVMVPLTLIHILTNSLLSLLFTRWNLSLVLLNSGFQLQTSGIDWKK